MSASHEVAVMCRCDDVEHCRMERYIADIRTLLTLYGDPLAPLPVGVLDATAIARPLPPPTLPNPSSGIVTGRPAVRV